MKCKGMPEFKEAFNKSSAIFLGEVVEIKPEIIDTTHQGKETFWDAKFKVLKSWRLVNKEYVWIDLPGRNTQCQKILKGNKYLVFAQEYTDKDLYIEQNSRLINSKDGLIKTDLQKLSKTETLKLESGTFEFYKNPMFDIAIALFIILIVASFLYFWIKKL